MLPSAEQVQQLYARLPPFLEAALLPFQREGVLFGLARNGRCLIAVRGRRAKQGSVMARNTSLLMPGELEAVVRWPAVPCLPPCQTASNTSTGLPAGPSRVIATALKHHPAAQYPSFPQDEMGVGKTVQAIALASCYQVGLPGTLGIDHGGVGWAQGCQAMICRARF